MKPHKQPAEPADWYRDEAGRPCHQCAVNEGNILLFAGAFAGRSVHCLAICNHCQRRWSRPDARYRWREVSL